MPCQGACSVAGVPITDPILGLHGCGGSSPWGGLRAGGLPNSHLPVSLQVAHGRSSPGTSGSPGKGTLAVWGWGLAVAAGHLEPSSALLSNPRLDLSDIPNSVRLVAPDVGILLVSSLCLCLCHRLVPKASTDAHSRGPETLESLEQVRANPGTIGTVPPSLITSPSPPQEAWHTGGLAWGHLRWLGTRVGAVSAARLSGERWSSGTLDGVTQARRSTRVCSGVAVGILANTSSLAGCGAGCCVVPCQPGLAVPARHQDAVVVAPVSPRQTQPQADGTFPAQQTPRRTQPSFRGLSPRPGCCCPAL